ncbi:MAG: methyltransferase domain-containing protein [Alphaproteobacteria bacterium]
MFSRLYAWWEGHDSTTEPSFADSDSPIADELDLDAEDSGTDSGENTARVWTPERIEAVQMVCGEGSSYAGGERFAVSVVKPLGLNETMSVLVCGAQLGLFARVIARDTGAWVDGLEPEPLLANAAARLSQVANLSKKASISEQTLVEAGIKEASRDAVISVEALHRQPDHNSELSAIARVLKPGGQLLFVDFVRKSEAHTTPAIDLWRAYEPAPPTIDTVNGLRKAMKQHDLKIRVTADITDDYCASLTQSLQGLAKKMLKHPPESAMHAAVLREVHYWGRRLAVLQTGDVGIVRVIAIRNKD